MTNSWWADAEGTEPLQLNDGVGGWEIMTERLEGIWKSSVPLMVSGGPLSAQTQKGDTLNPG